MAEFERGDRVHVAFSGSIVNDVDDDGYRIRVDGIAGRWYAVVPASSLTEGDCDDNCEGCKVCDETMMDLDPMEKYLSRIRGEG